MIASPEDYLARAQRMDEAADRLRGKAMEMFDAVDELRRRRADESLPFEERYRAMILIEEANELAKDHLDLVDRLTKAK